MIIWINGSFGSGKTSVATRLHEKIENSFIFDPEETGFYLRSNLPKEMLKNDFQDIMLWRKLNYYILREIATYYSGTLIVPMTLVDQVYYDEIIERLRQKNVEVSHYFLWASKETLRERLLGRGEDEEAWVFEQIERCYIDPDNKKFEKVISTESVTAEAVSEYILADLVQLYKRKFF